MASLVDIFNPSFFMFLGILVLVAALLVVYFESKNREQNNKMTSMLNLITCMADEMNAIKIHLAHQTVNFGVGPQSQPQHSSLETNNVHIVRTDLIAVSDDSDSDSDNDSENSIEDNDNSSDSDSDSGSESNSEDIEELQNIIEIGDNSDIKVLKLNLSNINDIDENKDVNDFEEIGDLEIIDEDDDLSIDSVSVSSNDEDNVNENKNDNDDNDNDEINISKLNLKSINISSLEEIKNYDNIDYKKLTLSKLRSTVVEKGLVVDSSKLKKNDLLKLLGAE